MGALLAISGSLRKDSLNTALARNARELVAADIELRVETLHGVPLYDGDLEQAQGIPEAVDRLKSAMREASGVVLVTPEYNNGIPGVFKNAIDWLSRPASGIAEVFGDRPFAVIGASPGGFGTTMAQAAWLPVLRTLGVRHWAGGRLMVSRAGGIFDEAGRLSDERVREQLKAFIEGFHGFATRRSES
ncbi:NADPH-dependent FMN reductase [Alkalisalibacterium limincola]|uniref:NAD(P)H-dependent oxidoreductase n=1 Tax=Alkalisalibacterium limincola TaxID=2699169 RepID=A0A5C8KMX7_9GAMM|nr:NADPH-dependent FMN reductase [Alkalisalibacterium limincola]TXK62098.1 NAD(P)H-dependent oxidoreductase [Alkalisalibacterium limincola]